MAGFAKYAANFMVVRAKHSRTRIRTGSRRVQEVGIPSAVANKGRNAVARYIWDTFAKHDASKFVVVVGVERKRQGVPTTPRESLPKALPDMSENPYRSAEVGIQSMKRSRAEAARVRWNGAVGLDLDKTRPDARAVVQHMTQLGYKGNFKWRRSASGKGVHVLLPPTRKGVYPWEVMKLRLDLGDDPVRVALDAARFMARKDRMDLRGVLFDYKGDKVAGRWHRGKV